MKTVLVRNSKGSNNYYIKTPKGEMELLPKFTMPSLAIDKNADNKLQDSTSDIHIMHKKYKNNLFSLQNFEIHAFLFWTSYTFF